MVGEVGEEERGDGLAGHALVVGGRESLREDAVVQERVELVLGRHGVGHDQGRRVAPESVLPAHHRGDLGPGRAGCGFRVFGAGAGPPT